MHIGALISQLTHYAHEETRKHTSLVLNHVEVLVFGGHVAFLVVPVYVPSLAYVNIGHLLTINLVNRQLLFFRNELVDLGDRLEIHKVACVYCVIDTKLLVCA